MNLPDRPDLTALLNRMFKGDQEAGNVAMDAMYASLRRVASAKLRRERPGHLLQTTALVHEAMARLFGTKAITVQNRQHFFALACLLMRRTLIEWGRRGELVFTSLEEAMAQTTALDRERMLGIERILARFSELDPLAYRAFQLKIGAGMTGEEVAGEMGCSRAAVNRYLARARTWLQRELVPYLAT